MRKTIVLLFLVFAASGIIRAEQREITMLNLGVPLGLSSGESYFNFAHKFMFDMRDYGDANYGLTAPLDNGVSMNLGFRAMIWEGIEAGIYYNGLYSEKRASLSYNRMFEEMYLRASFYMEYFDFSGDWNAVHYDEYSENSMKMFYLLSLQTEYLFDIATLTANIGYDSYREKAVAGLGAAVRFLDKYSLIAEWYPVFKNGTGGYSIGFKAETYGHQFVFMLGNTFEQGARNALSGGSESVHIGFNIQRLISF